MQFSFLPGCALSSSAKAYARSLYWVFDQLQIEIKELPYWSCCGAMGAHMVNLDLSYALPARNLAIAADMDKDLMTACPVCYNKLKVTQQILKSDASCLERVERILGRELKVGIEVEVKTILEVLQSKRNLEKISQQAGNLLREVKVSCYYGCLVTHLDEMQGFQGIEDLTAMETLVEASGAEAVLWPCSIDCCGAGFSIINEEVCKDFCRRILDMAARSDADIIVTSCPLCQHNLDWAQWKLASEGKKESFLPVVFITQLLGVALGGTSKEMMLDSNLTGSKELLQILKGRIAR